ncbi:MAG TPA: hypothetical protein VGV91_10185, partial [Rubrobacter sp.]|nr:hypothetical protein [Rubrobacter sp.]
MTSDAPRPPVTCPHYDPLPGARRCRHYVPNGACERPDELMCVEWLKANGSAKAVARAAGAPAAPALPTPPAAGEDLARADGPSAGGAYYVAWRHAFGEGPARPTRAPRVPP